MRIAAYLFACVAIPGAALALANASLPRALAQPGLWEVTKDARGSRDERRCLRDPAILTQWEHRSMQCTRVIVKSDAAHAEVHYTCPNGGFGTSKVTVLTPRSVRIETQGISDGLPFNYVVHARHQGNCPSR